MSIATSSIATRDGTRLIERLCAHWGHKFPVEARDGQARIAFDEATHVRLEADADRLLAAIETPETARIVQLQDVVAEHLQRMARGETLRIEWTAAAAA